MSGFLKTRQEQQDETWQGGDAPVTQTQSKDAVENTGRFLELLIAGDCAHNVFREGSIEGLRLLG
jgi:hypothetical protein